MITLETIKEAVDLLKRFSTKEFVTIAELSKELKISKIELMKFIESNPKLFRLSERWEPKEKTVTVNRSGCRYKEKISVRGKALGVCVDRVFRSPEENDLTDEWLEVMKKTYEKFINISVIDDYGHVIGYQVVEDTGRTGEWRNTKEKIQWLLSEGFVCPTTHNFGCFGDSYSRKFEYGISSRDIENLKELGWTTNGFEKVK